MLETILLAIDRSAHAAEAARLTGYLARAFGSRVRVLHALETPVAAAMAGATVMPERWLEPEVEARALVAGEVSRLRSAGIEVEGLLDESAGTFAERIVRYAAQIDAGLIALGATGPGLLNPLALGSVAHGVVNAADRDVLVVRESRRLETGRPLRSLTAGVDGSPESLRAAALAVDLARRLAAPVQLISVRTAQPPSTDLEDLLDRLAGSARADGVPATISILDGDPVDCLDTVAGLELGGALVVGRGRRGLGSITHRLLRTTWLPVFVAAGRGGLPQLG